MTTAWRAAKDWVVRAEDMSAVRAALAALEADQ